MKDRRTKEGYKLRVYMDQIREVKSMSDERWIEEFVKYNKDGPYVPRLAWLAYLEECALIEAEKLLTRVA